MPWGFWLGGAFLLFVLVASIWDGLKEDKRETAILCDLLFYDWAFGRDLVKRNAELGRGTVYVTLGRMEQRGLLASREEKLSPSYVGLPQRLYSLTNEGRDEALRRAGAKEIA